MKALFAKLKKEMPKGAMKDDLDHMDIMGSEIQDMKEEGSEPEELDIHDDAIMKGEDDKGNELSAISDDDLIAEIKARGLSKALKDNMPEAPEEE